MFSSPGSDFHSAHNHLAVFLSRLVPATINTAITTLTVFEGEAVSLPCQVSGFPFPNDTQWCRQASQENITCPPVNNDNETVWSSRWSEQILSADVPSGTLLLETESVNVVDNGTAFVCRSSNGDQRSTDHSITLNIIGEQYLRPYIAT